MSSYTKLHAGILYSTVWQASDSVLRLWIALLVMKDRDGMVEATLPGLAMVTGKSMEETQSGLDLLLSPDPYSRSREHEGRRIKVVDGGWMVLNHDKYNEKSSGDDYRKKAADRMVRLRARSKLRNGNSPVTQRSPSDPTLILLCSDPDPKEEEKKRIAVPSVGSPDLFGNPPRTKTRKAKDSPTDAEQASIRAVLEKLSKHSGVRYSADSEQTRLILNQLRAGVSEEDLRKVIGYCALEKGWEEDPKMRQYLRPATLFGPRKISDYLDPARSWFAELQRQEGA